MQSIDDQIYDLNTLGNTVIKRLKRVSVLSWVIIFFSSLVLGLWCYFKLDHPSSKAVYKMMVTNNHSHPYVVSVQLEGLLSSTELSQLSQQWGLDGELGGFYVESLDGGKVAPKESVIDLPYYIVCYSSDPLFNQDKFFASVLDYINTLKVNVTAYNFDNKNNEAAEKRLKQQLKELQKAKTQLLSEEKNVVKDLIALIQLENELEQQLKAANWSLEHQEMLKPLSQGVKIEQEVQSNRVLKSILVALAGFVFMTIGCLMIVRKKGS